MTMTQKDDDYRALCDLIFADVPRPVDANGVVLTNGFSGCSEPHMPGEARSPIIHVSGPGGFTQTVRLKGKALDTWRSLDEPDERDFA